MFNDGFRAAINNIEVHRSRNCARFVIKQTSCSSKDNSSSIHSIYLETAA